MTPMVELLEKNTKVAITDVFHVFRYAGQEHICGTEAEFGENESPSIWHPA